MKEKMEIVKVSLLAVIAVSMVYMAFIKKEKRRLNPTASAYQPQSQPTPVSPNNQYFGPEDDLNISTTINNREDASLDATPQPLDMPATQLAWAETAHDFGTIKQQTENTHVFSFTNSGENPLIIQNAEGSCGCTVPEYPKEPIAPGETGEIIVKYSPGYQIGQQNKTVSITANTNPPISTLNISALVEEVVPE